MFQEFDNGLTGQVVENIVVFAKTPDIQQKVNKLQDAVTVSLDTTNDKWEMTVYYQSSRRTGWVTAAIVALVISSLLLAIMAFGNMIQKQSLCKMQKQYMEDLAHPQKFRLRQFLEDHYQGEGPSAEDEERILKVKPIAEVFPSTTVL